MRDALARLDGQRITVEAAVIRHGSCIGWTGVRMPTLCLGPITSIGGEVLADHLWFPRGKRLEALSLQPGDTLRLVARVRPYRRKTGADVSDYQLVYPTRITLIARAPLPVEPSPPAPVATPSPPPALVLPAGLSNRERLLAALSGRAGADPLSLTRLLTTLPMSPISAVKLLRDYAKQGHIAFTPDGALVVPSIAFAQRSV